MRPIPNTLHIKWQLDTTISDTNSETFQVNPTALTEGLHTLTASVVDETTLLHVDDHATVHISTVTWTINKSNLGTHTSATNSKIAYKVYPNPSQDFINVAFDIEKNSNVAIDLVAADGKIIQQIPAKMVAAGASENSINISGIESATYFIVVTIDGVKHTTTMIKK
jgi:hypothetical protein